MLKFFSKQKKPSESKNSLALIVVIVVFAVAIVIRFMHWIKPIEPPILLTQTEGMIEITTLDELSAVTQTPVKPPTNTFESTLQTIGIYPNQNDYFPQGTVAVVYVRNEYRFVEIRYQPQTTKEQELSTITELPQENIKLTKEIEATLVTLRDRSYCRKPLKEEVGVCQITRALFFQKDDQVVILSADGTHASDGELIGMARSIINE